MSVCAWCTHDAIAGQEVPVVAHIRSATRPATIVPITTTRSTFLKGNQFDPLPSVNSSYTDWLPSFNVRFHLGDEWQSRFSLSQSMVRPDFANMINQETLGFTFCSRRPIAQAS